MATAVPHTETPGTSAPAPIKHFVVPKTSANFVKMFDKFMDGFIRLGGVLVIGSVLAILFFVGREAVPLFFPATGKQLISSQQLPGLAAGQTAKLIGADPDQTLYYYLSSEGKLAFFDCGTWLPKQEAVAFTTPEGAALTSPITASYRSPYHDHLFLGLQDGTVSIQRLDFASTFVGKKRSVTATVAPLYAGAAAEGAVTSPVSLVRGREHESTAVIAAVTEDQSIYTGLVDENGAYTGEQVKGALEGKIIDMCIDSENSDLLLLTDKGVLYHYNLDVSRETPTTVLRLSTAERAAKKIEFLIGDGSFVAGFADGTLDVYMPVRSGGKERAEYQFAYSLPKLGAEIVSLSPASHSRGMVAGAKNGELAVLFSTSRRKLLSFDMGATANQVVYGAKQDEIFATDDKGHFNLWEISNPHPEITFATLFGKVWYEGADKPEYSWQSSSGSDAFEAKYSLMPLAVGTLKGAFYGLLFAVPVAVFAAIYTSQFMHPANRSIVKPTIEIMAAMPSVVIGFLAGLWLAPLLENITVTVLLMVFFIPATVFAAFMGYARVPSYVRDQLPAGMELFMILPAVIVGGLLAYLVGPVVEGLVFEGNFRQWVFDTFGQQFEQRNCIVIGIAMGFAVIPLIFTISEDAMSNVPRHFVSASLALGASKWQTATRVILPTASPGIFSAVMVGFGRAVGETMIVLMATGNTPVMSFSPFNGMRTLSANIAVEVPEAPVGSTHYRVLFLAAVLLFLITFTVNTAAEVIRQRLREKYRAV